MAYIYVDSMFGEVDLTTADNAGPGPFSLTGTNAGKMGRQSFLGQTVRGYDTNLGGGEFMFLAGPTTNTTGQTISSITISGSTATVTTGSAHGLLVGAVVILSGQAPAAYAGTFTVLTVPSTTTFTYAISGSSVPVTSATTVGTYVNGTIQVGQVCEITSTISNGAVVLTATPWAGTSLSGKTLCVALTSLTANQYGWFQIEGIAITATAGAPAAGNVVNFSATGIVQPTVVASKQVINATYASAVSQTIGTGASAVTLGSAQALVLLNRPSAQGAIT